VRGDQHVQTVEQLRCDVVVPVGQDPNDDVFQALGRREHIRWEMRVTGIVRWMFGAVERHRRRRRVVAAPPGMHLFGAVALRGLLLVEALQRSVVTFVEPPTALDRQPRLIHGVERQVLGDHGSRLQRRVRRVEPEPGRGHGDPGRGCLGTALVGERHVVPPREQVGEVPLGLAVTEDDERSGHASDRRAQMKPGVLCTRFNNGCWALDGRPAKVDTRIGVAMGCRRKPLEE